MRNVLVAALIWALAANPLLAQSLTPANPGGSGSGTVTSVVCPSATITTTGNCNPLSAAGTSGDVITGAGSNNVQDSGTLLSSLAPLASPTFTGTPTVPGYAPLASPAFTGTATAVNLTVSGTCSGCGSGSGITALTGDVTASGSGSVAATVAKIAGVAVGTPTGTTNVVFSNSPTLVTPTLGAALATSINGDTFTTGTYTLTGTAAKTLNFTNTLTLSGTDSTTMTFPASSTTVAGLGIAQTFTAAQTSTTWTIASAGTLNLAGAGKIIVGTAPTITSGLGTSPAVTNANGSAAFELTTSAAGSPATATVLALPTASHGWHCNADDLTTTTEVAHQTGAVSATAVTLTWYAITTGLATAPTASDIIVVTCMGF